MKLEHIMVILMVIVFPVSAIGEMTEDNGAYLLSTTGAKWWMQFPKSNFELQIRKSTPDGKSYYYMFTNNVTKLNVSFFIEPVRNCINSTDCRDKFWVNPGPLVNNPTNVRKYDQNNFAIVEYYLANLKFEGLTVDQMNVSGHIVRDGYWVDMHISKVLFKNSDMELFKELINSIGFKTR